MSADVSKKTVVILLIIAIVVAIGGTLIVLNKSKYITNAQASGQDSATESNGPPTVGLVKVEILPRPETNKTSETNDSEFNEIPDQKGDQ